jgi:hypothetical protein
MGYRFPGHRPGFLFWLRQWSWWLVLLITVTVVAATSISTGPWRHADAEVVQSAAVVLGVFATVSWRMRKWPLVFAVGWASGRAV